jgi:hypothetical protein
MVFQNIHSYPPYLLAFSTIRNLMTRRVVVTRDTPDIHPHHDFVREHFWMNTVTGYNSIALRTTMAGKNDKVISGIVAFIPIFLKIISLDEYITDIIVS